MIVIDIEKRVGYWHVTMSQRMLVTERDLYVHMYEVTQQ
jgi:hypothetical protein